MNAQANVELVRAATERIATDGPRTLLDHFDEFFTEDFRWAPITAHTVEGSEYEGREGFARYLDDLETTFAQLTVEIPSIQAVGDDTVMVQLRMQARGTESGIPVDLDLHWVLRFEGPRIVSGRTYMSRDDALAAAERAAHA
jgi:ketosteroid isomerase-like protein